MRAHLLAERRQRDATLIVVLTSLACARKGPGAAVAQRRRPYAADRPGPERRRSEDHQGGRIRSVHHLAPGRAVAPVVPRECFGDYFSGPADSSFMGFAHRVRVPWNERLVALRHPDGSTRAQTLEREEDPELHALLFDFDELVEAVRRGLLVAA